jgi:phenylpropionate dioxygenase-like ring-hydroxylating dioxygenase large terminal subunit
MKQTPDGTPVLQMGRGVVRDMPISYEHQMENLADPAHFNFAHHGVGAQLLLISQA